MRRAWKLLAGGALALLLVVGLTSPAVASSALVDLPPYGGGFANDEHTRVYTCDYRADGWGVRTYYWLNSDPLNRAGLVGDGNGSAEGCGARTVTTTSNPVIFLEVCAGPNGENRVCSGKYYIGLSG